MPNYAFKVAMKAMSTGVEWRIIENTLLVWYRRDPSLVRVVADTLVLRNFYRKDVNKESIGGFVRNNLQRLIQNDSIGELVWMLFICKALRIEIKREFVEDLYGSSSGIVAMILCDLERMGLVDGGVDKVHWNTFATKDGLRSEMWLYVYDAAVKGWSGTGVAHIDTEPYFRILRRNRVSFYDITKNFAPLETRRSRNRLKWLKEQVAFQNAFPEVGAEEIAEFETEFDPYEFSVYD